MVNDVISDMVTRIRNSGKVKHHLVRVLLTIMTKEIAQVLKKEKRIRNFRELAEKNKKSLLLLLKYKGKGRNQKPVITTKKRISKPGLRVYAKAKELPIMYGSFGIVIMSTSKGIMTNRKASKLGVGGEILCYIW